MWYTFRVCKAIPEYVGVHTLTLEHGGPKLMLACFLDCSPVPQAVSPTDPELTNSAR